MKTTRHLTCLLTGSFFILLLVACDKQDTESQQSGKLVALTVATPQISETDENAEITSRAEQAVFAPQTVTAIPCTVFTNGHEGVSVSIPSLTIGGGQNKLYCYFWH